MGGPANITVQVQIEVSITNRHQVDAPLAVGFAIDTYEHWNRLAPAWLYGIGSDRAYEDVRIDAANLYHRGEYGSHAVICAFLQKLSSFIVVPASNLQ